MALFPNAWRCTLVRGAVPCCTPYAVAYARCCVLTCVHGVSEKIGATGATGRDGRTGSTGRSGPPGSTGVDPARPDLGGWMVLPV